MNLYPDICIPDFLFIYKNITEKQNKTKSETLLAQVFELNDDDDDGDDGVFHFETGFSENCREN